ncbi:MAG: flippase activity-associated protein Agl23 [Candidatus Neomarinimicrobiota bacterium]
MKWQRTPVIFILLSSLVALSLRLPKLEDRPMHGDEAIHAVKLGRLLEDGYYRYNPQEFHGPTLNYVTLIPARLSGVRELKDLNETVLRIVPVFFGVLLAVLPFLLIDGLSLRAVIISSFIAAISPAMVFFSRYYIQETLFVFFTFGTVISAFRYTKNRTSIWAVLTGLFFGLTHATKETSLVVFSSMVLAFILTVSRKRTERGGAISFGNMEKVNLRHGAIAILVGALVSGLFHSSFLSNPEGFVDAFRSYGAYLSRGTQSDWHIHSWYYYLKILLYSRFGSGPVWSEGLIIILALCGIVALMTKSGIAGVSAPFGRYIAYFTLIMTAIFSAIPYKTPWNLLTFHYGMILLAGLGATVIIRSQKSYHMRIVVAVLLTAGAIQLVRQTYLANFRYSSDPVNPYVYAHPRNDVIAVARRVEAVSRAHPSGEDLPIQVIWPGDDYWPLPWYLRSFSNVGWWNTVDESAPNAPLIIASPEVETDLVSKLYGSAGPGEVHLYVPLFDSYIELRPGVELRGYIRNDLLERLERQ